MKNHNPEIRKALHPFARLQDRPSTATFFFEHKKSATFNPIAQRQPSLESRVNQSYFSTSDTR